MLTQLTTVKTRLTITDPSSDGILTAAIAAVSDRFDRECNRKFARQTNVVEEFAGDCLEIIPANWPIESVSAFEVKTNETTGWQSISPEYLLRNQCVISLQCALGGRFQQARVTYTGGYVLPGDTVGPGQTALPSDVEQACIEQVAYWYQNRTTIGILTSTSTTGSHIETVDLLPSVAAVLKKYTRMTI